MRHPNSLTQGRPPCSSGKVNCPNPGPCVLFLTSLDLDCGFLELREIVKELPCLSHDVAIAVTKAK